MSAAANAAGWLCVHDRIPVERKEEQERWPIVEEVRPVEKPQPRQVTVTYRKRKVIEHA